MQTTALLDDCRRVAVQGNVSLDGAPLRWGMIAFHPTGPRANRQPVAWAMIGRNGAFSIPAHRGVVVGKNRVAIVNFGDVRPNPSISDEQRIDGPEVNIEGENKAMELRVGSREE